MQGVEREIGGSCQGIRGVMQGVERELNPIKKFGVSLPKTNQYLTLLILYIYKDIK